MARDPPDPIPLTRSTDLDLFHPQQNVLPIPSDVDDDAGTVALEVGGAREIRISSRPDAKVPKRIGVSLRRNSQNGISNRASFCSSDPGEHVHGGEVVRGASGAGSLRRAMAESRISRSGAFPANRCRTSVNAASALLPLASSTCRCSRIHDTPNTAALMAQNTTNTATPNKMGAQRRAFIRSRGATGGALCG